MSSLKKSDFAHLLRELKDIDEKFEEAIPLHNALKELYEILNDALETDPSPKVREELSQLAREALKHWTLKEYYIENFQRFSGESKNGLITGLHLSSIQV